MSECDGRLYTAGEDVGCLTQKLENHALLAVLQSEPDSGFPELTVEAVQGCSSFWGFCTRLCVLPFKVVQITHST